MCRTSLVKIQWQLYSHVLTIKTGNSLASPFVYRNKHLSMTSLEVNLEAIFIFFCRPLCGHQPASGRESNWYQGDQRGQRLQPRMERSIPVWPAPWWHHSATTGLGVYRHAGRKFCDICPTLLTKQKHAVSVNMPRYRQLNIFLLGFLQGRRYTKTSILGRVLIGCGAPKAGQDHWEEMCSQGQTETARWHTIQSDVL